MKLAIVGSRDFQNWDTFTKGIVECIADWGQIECIISGGAPGADTMAENFAKENEFKIITVKENTNLELYNGKMFIFRPNWSKHGRRAGILRNTDIVDNATHVLAFPSHKGRGTQDTIRKAKKKGIPINIIFID